MAVFVVGKKYYDWTNPDDKKRYQGLKLHVVDELENPKSGKLVDTVKVSDMSPVYPLADSIPFGSLVTIVYDKYGRPQDFIMKSSPDGQKSGK